MILNCAIGEIFESPLDCKEIQPIHSKRDQFWVFTGRTDAKAETPILWPPDGKSWLIGKDSDAGRDQGQEEKRTTEDEMAGWHNQLNGHEFEWTLGVGDGQGGLACCNSWGCKDSDMTERLNWTELNWMVFLDFFFLWPVSCSGNMPFKLHILWILFASLCLISSFILWTCGQKFVWYDFNVFKFSHLFCGLTYHPAPSILKYFSFSATIGWNIYLVQSTVTL